MTDYLDGNGDGTDVIDGGTPATPADQQFDIVDGNVLILIGDPSAVSEDDETREMHIESLDGSLVIPLNVDVDRILKAGATGLGLPPLDVVTSTTPGMPGSWLQEVNVLEREVFIPLEFGSDKDQADMLAKLKQLRELVWPGAVNIGDLGTFLLVCNSPAGERILTVTYKSGWEGTWGGADSGINWESFGLTLVAVDPYFRDRNPTNISYTATPGEVFLGDGDNSTPWPRQLSQSVVIGQGMQVVVQGDVPVWPKFVFTGPVNLADVTFPGTDVSVPNGIADESTLTLITDPRARSARLDGAIAWSAVAMGSTFAPLNPGMNIVNVEIGTFGADTGLLLEWTPGYKNPW